MINIPCVILSGGASRRMGEDKSLLPFKKFDTLIEYQHSKLSKIFNTIFISSKNNKFNFDAQLLIDESQSIYSPMIALKSILKNIQEEKVFITTVDVPFIEIDTFKKLVSYCLEYDITIAKDRYNTHNLCGVFSKSLLPLIEKLLNDDIHKMNTLIKSSSNYKEILFENDQQFANINTKDEYNKYIL
ncbi:NTP transferase domain-containing protein [Arcobacteraceae bacterium]|nr:NTP transferase domain-containing protein [Arcobacteraceae bacterium]